MKNVIFYLEALLLFAASSVAHAWRVFADPKIAALGGDAKPGGELDLKELKQRNGWRQSNLPVCRSARQKSVVTLISALRYRPLLPADEIATLCFDPTNRG
jgi:hypothetical protein